MNLEKLKEVVDSFEETMFVINEPNIDWEIKYDFVFENLALKVREAGIHLEYCDPDTSYEEDVMAYINALNAKLRSYDNLISALLR